MRHKVYRFLLFYQQPFPSPYPPLTMAEAQPDADKPDNLTKAILLIFQPTDALLQLDYDEYNETIPTDNYPHLPKLIYNAREIKDHLFFSIDYNAAYIPH